MGAKGIQDHLGWGRLKRKEILEYMRRKDIVPLPLLCAEACGVTRATAANWLRKGQSGDPEYEFFARTALQLRADYIQKLLQELLNDGASPAATKARQYLLSRMSQEDFEPPPVKVHAPPHREGAPELPGETIGEVVELLSLPPSKD